MPLLKERNLSVKISPVSYYIQAILLSILLFCQDTMNRTHVKEIPGTRLLVSLYHSFWNCAKIELFDLSCREKVKKIYSFEQVIGGNFHVQSHVQSFELYPNLC